LGWEAITGGGLEPDKERIVSVDQLPDDPLEMPPPYWRTSGAIFCMLDALESIADLLTELVPVHNETEAELDLHYERHAEEYEKYADTEDDFPEELTEKFSDIMDELWELEHKVKTRAMVACLTSAIEAEDEINKFCVYNLHKDAAESIEKLSPPDRLLVAAGMVGHQIGKGHAAYGAMKALTRWRNAFAHGHCVDRPTRSLRHNHLIHPDEHPGIVSHLAELRRLVSGYVRVSEYLASISKNKYGKGGSYEVERSKELLAEISRYQFGGSEHVYTITVSNPKDE
jgi:hypothetical protein